MNESKRRAWQALGIGPAWRSRAPGSAAVEASEARLEAEWEAESGAQSGAQPSVQPEAQRQGMPPATDAVAALDWPALRAAVAGCRACGLCETRQNTVFGVGDEHAEWMVIGEAPGAEEDRRGEPFVGRAGQLLDAMLASVGKSREQGVFIANVLKCRPPENRNPLPEEAARCAPYLRRQIELVSPGLILVAGKIAAQALLDTEASIASLRGRVHRYRAGEREIPLVVTYHPAYLLRTPLDKAKAWADLRLAASTSARAG